LIKTDFLKKGYHFLTRKYSHLITNIQNFLKKSNNFLKNFYHLLLLADSLHLDTEDNINIERQNPTNDRVAHF